MNIAKIPALCGQGLKTDPLLYNPWIDEADGWAVSLTSETLPFQRDKPVPLFTRTFYLQAFRSAFQRCKGNGIMYWASHQKEAELCACLEKPCLCGGSQGRHFRGITS